MGMKHPWSAFMRKKKACSRHSERRTRTQMRCKVWKRCTMCGWQKKRQIYCVCLAREKKRQIYCVCPTCEKTETNFRVLHVEKTETNRSCLSYMWITWTAANMRTEVDKRQAWRMYIYIYIYIYIYMYIYMRTEVDKRQAHYLACVTHVSPWLRTVIPSYDELIHIYIMHTYIYIYLHTYVHRYTHAHTHMCMHWLCMLGRDIFLTHAVDRSGHLEQLRDTIFSSVFLKASVGSMAFDSMLASRALVGA